MFYDRTRKIWPFNKGYWLIELPTWPGLTRFFSVYFQLRQQQWLGWLQYVLYLDTCTVAVVGTYMYLLYNIYRLRKLKTQDKKVWYIFRCFNFQGWLLSVIKMISAVFEMFYDRTRKIWPFNKGYWLIEMPTWPGLTRFFSVYFQPKLPHYYVLCLWEH